MESFKEIYWNWKIYYFAKYWILPRIFNTNHKVLINIHASLINCNSGPAINVGATLIDSKNDSNDYGKNQKNCTLAMRYKKTIKSSASLFLASNIYKYIRFLYFWLSCSITIIFAFAKITSSSISIIRTFMICTSTNIFTISSNKKLEYVFLFFKSNIN